MRPSAASVVWRPSSGTPSARSRKRRKAAVGAVAPDHRRDHGRVEERDVGGLHTLAEDAPEAAGRWVAESGPQGMADVVEARSRDRGVRRDPMAAAGIGDGFPALDRAPVVADDVRRRIGADRIDHAEQVVGEVLEAVGVRTRRRRRVAHPAHVVRHDVVTGGEVCGDVVPHDAGIWVAVHQHDRRAGRGLPPIGRGGRRSSCGRCSHASRWLSPHISTHRSIIAQA